MSNLRGGFTNGRVQGQPGRGNTIRSGNNAKQIMLPSASRDKPNPSAYPTRPVPARGGSSSNLLGTSGEVRRSSYQTPPTPSPASIQPVMHLPGPSAVAASARISPSQDTAARVQRVQPGLTWAKVADGRVPVSTGKPLIAPTNTRKAVVASEPNSRIPPPKNLVFPPEQLEKRQKQAAVAKLNKEAAERERELKKREEELKRQQKLAAEQEKEKKDLELKTVGQRFFANAIALEAANKKLNDVLESLILPIEQFPNTRFLQPLLEEIHKYTRNWPYDPDEIKRKDEIRLKVRGVFISLCAAPDKHHIIFAKEYRKSCLEVPNWFIKRQDKRVTWASEEQPGGKVVAVRRE